MKEKKVYELMKGVNTTRLKDKILFDLGYKKGKLEQKKEELEFLDNLIKRKTMTQGTLDLIFSRIKQLQKEIEKANEKN